MNISVTRFLIFFILSFILPYSVNSYSLAVFEYGSGWEIKWESKGGYANVTSNSVKVYNISNNAPCFPAGCAISLESDVATYFLANLGVKATLAQVQTVISSLKGQTTYRADKTLCLYMIVGRTIQQFPLNCYDGKTGTPPTVVDPPVAPPVTCNIGSGTINHLVASTSVDRDTASTTVSVSCTGSTTVRVRALNYYPNNGGMTLNGPDTLKSLIAIDNISAEIGTVKRVDYYRNFTVSSELRSAAKDIAGGEYSGSLIIVVSTQ